MSDETITIKKVLLRKIIKELTQLNGLTVFDAKNSNITKSPIITHVPNTYLIHLDYNELLKEIMKNIKKQ